MTRRMERGTWKSLWKFVGFFNGFLMSNGFLQVVLRSFVSPLDRPGVTSPENASESSDGYFTVPGLWTDSDSAASYTTPYNSFLVITLLL